MSPPERAPIPIIRPYAVCNGYGEHLQSFEKWEAAHAWAHEKAAAPNAILPMEVEDRAQRVTTRVTRDSCELIVWTVYKKETWCDQGTAPAPPFLPGPPQHVGG